MTIVAAGHSSRASSAGSASACSPSPRETVPAQALLLSVGSHIGSVSFLSLFLSLQPHSLHSPTAHRHLFDIYLSRSQHAMSTRKRKQDADEEEELQSLPEDDSEEEEE